MSLIGMQEPQAHAKLLPTILDEQGSPVDLAACMAQERTNLCQVPFQPHINHLKCGKYNFLEARFSCATRICHRIAQLDLTGMFDR